MDATARAAATAYRSLADLAAQRTSPAAGEDGDFAGMVHAAAANFIEQGRSAEQAAQAFAAGRANLVDVVTAVAETEVALETIVAVRDRMIQAYEEIMRMPI